MELEVVLKLIRTSITKILSSRRARHRRSIFRDRPGKITGTGGVFSAAGGAEETEFL